MGRPTSSQGACGSCASSQSNGAGAESNGANGCAKPQLINGKTAEEWSHICMNVCGGRCCRHIAWAIDTPKTKEDFEQMRYALMHPKVSFFKEDGEWYLCVITTCEKLLANNGCGIYPTRPQICRDYQAGECEWPDGVDWEIHIEDDYDLQEYLDKRLKRRREGIPYSLHNRAELIVWEIEDPVDEEDYDCMRWAVLHNDIAFFREEGDWYMCVATPQARENLDDEDFEIYIQTQEELRAYWDRRNKRKRQPAVS